MSQPQTSNQQSPQALEAALIGLYGWAQTVLLAGIARIARRTVPTLEGSLLARAQVRHLSAQVVARLAAETPALVAAVIDSAASDAVGGGVVPPGARTAAGGASGGGVVALRDLGGIAGGGGGGNIPPAGAIGGGNEFDPYMLHGVRAAQAIRNDLTNGLADVRFRLTRLDDDLYKLITPPGAAGQVIPNGYTPQQAQAKAWQELTRRGITGFTDKSGRDWSLSAYVEMAVRTASMRAYNASRTAVIQAQGLNLVTVSSDGHPCPLCFPWQDRILCIVPDGVTPSVADATAAGLWHPNCRHSLSAFLPGFSKLPAPREWTPAMQAAYDATQKQRGLERAIRQAKQELKFARTPDTRQQARKDIRAGQQKLRDFLTQNPDLLRQSRREQLDLSMQTMKLTPYGG